MVLKKRAEEEIKAKILEVMTLVKAKQKKVKQRKKLKSGKIQTYLRTDFFIRLPSRMKGGDNRPLAVFTWEGIETLLTIKAMYGLTDDELTWLLLKIFSELE